MKKKPLSLVILVVAICLNISINTEVFTTYAMMDTSAEISETSFFENQNRSIALYDEAISQYRSISNRGKDEAVTYSDDFAGVFIDDKGFLNIALVQSGQNEPTFNGQILYRQHQFSYNYLQEIKEAVVDVMTTFGIHMVGVDEKANRVSVYISEASKIEEISNFIMEQTWFDDTAVNYIVESAAVQHNPSYGGESISAAGFRGTICVAAIDNITGRLGILTNEHVVPTGTASNYRGHWNGSTFSTNVALGTALRGQHAGTIDASFVPYTNQGNWEISPYGRYDATTYTNIRLGNNDQIVQGRTVRKIGQTSGITNGTITNANMTVSLDYGTPGNPNIQAITNVFRYSNESLGGDSGGPVYFNDGTDLHLIGMNFAGPSNPTTATFGIACRIQNVMNILNVTPITNDSFNTTDLTSTTVSLNGINFNPTGAFVIPNHLNGRTLTKIGSSTFSGQSQLSQVSIPSSVTHIGSDAFKNTNNASIYLINRTKAPSTFNINWNSSVNPVYLNGTLCPHTSSVATVSLDDTHHGNLCNDCRTVFSKSLHRKYTSNGWQYCYDCSYTKNVGHSHSYTHTWLNLRQHQSSCSCGDTRVRPHIVSGDWNGIGYATCLDCGGPAELGLVMFGALPRMFESLSSIYIREYFGNGSFILSNEVIVLSYIDLEAYYNGTLVLPDTYDFDYHHNHDCVDCSNECIDCDADCHDCVECESYCRECVDCDDMDIYYDIRKTLYVPTNRKERDYFDNRAK